MNGAALMQFRNGSTRSKLLLGANADPTMIRLRNHGVFQLLAFHLTVSHQTNPSLYSLKFFLRAGQQVSLAGCAALSDIFRGLTTISSVSWDVRPDRWFLESPGFPALYPFDETLRIPTEFEFVTGATAGCGYVSGRELRCGGSDFTPRKGPAACEVGHMDFLVTRTVLRSNVQW